MDTDQIFFTTDSPTECTEMVWTVDCDTKGLECEIIGNSLRLSIPSTTESGTHTIEFSLTSHSYERTWTTEVEMNSYITGDSSWPDDGLCYYFGNPILSDKVCNDTYKFHKNEYLEGGYFHIVDFYATADRTTISYNQPLSLILKNEIISDNTDSSFTHSLS